MNDIEQQVNSILQLRGITKKELANRIGVRSQNINSYFRNPQLKNLLTIANALHCSLDELCGLKTNSYEGLTCPHCGAKLNVRID